MLSILLTLFPIFAPEVNHWPIEPVSLRRQLEVVDYIVIGRAGTPEPIEIIYQANLVCPAPARFYSGEVHIAFLERARGGRYRPNALSYGVRKLTPAGVQAMTDAIRHWDLIQTLESEERKKMSMLNWLVNLGKHSSTRYDLKLEFDHHDGVDKSGRCHEWPYLLTDFNNMQKERVLNFLGAATEFENHDGRVYDLFRMNPDERITRFLVGWIAQWDDLPHDGRRYLREALYRVPNARGRLAFELLTTKSYGKSKSDPERTELEAAWAIAEHCQVALDLSGKSIK